jgi:hypothetical protein
LIKKGFGFYVILCDLKLLYVVFIWDVSSQIIEMIHGIVGYIV